MSYKDGDGNTVMIKEEKIPQTINNILPKDLSSYFFFDTERVQDVSERKDLANAVKGLLGLSVLDNGIRHLGEKGKKTSVIGKFYQALGQYSGDKKIPEMINRIEELTNASKDLKQNVEEYKKEIECYERNREQLDRQLAKNENSKELQQQRLSIEYEIKNTEHDIRSKTVDLQKYLSTNLKFFLVQPLIDEALKMIKRNPVNDRGIEGLTASVLKGILSRGTCVCGQKVMMLISILWRK
jgi:DNA sulfur modification protein DndD